MCRRHRATERKRFIEFGGGTNQNVLREEDVTRISGTVQAFGDVDRYARVVGLDQVERNDFNLNISRYVETAEAVFCNPVTIHG